MTAALSVRHDGIAVRLGDRDYIVPPLTFRQLRLLQPQLAIVGGSIGPVMGEERLGAIIAIAHQALQRNYPELDQDAVEELVDLGNAARLMQAIAGISGLSASEAVPGEALAGPESSQESIGTN